MKLMLNGKEVTGMGHYVMAGDIKDATAEDSNVLSGKAYYNNSGKREGTMPNRGGMSAELAAGGSVSIQAGYHNGEGVVRAQDLASQTQGTAAAANIEAGYTAWVNGEMVEGTGKMDPWKVVQDFGDITVEEYQQRFDYLSRSNYLRLTDKMGDVFLIPLECSYLNNVVIVGRSSSSYGRQIQVRDMKLTSGKRVEVYHTSTSYKLGDYITKIEEVSMA